MTPTHSARLEAVLFAAGEAVSKKRLATLLSLSPEELRDAAITLHHQLHNRGLALIEAGEEIEMRTAPEVSEDIGRLREGELSRDLGKAGLEALAIILYKNGATRSEIDWVRGVNSAAALRSLTLRGLIVRAEDATDRRRIRYTATVEALAHLGVSSVSQLPNHAEFAEALSAAQTELGEKISETIPTEVLVAMEEGEPEVDVEEAIEAVLLEPLPSDDHEEF